MKKTLKKNKIIVFYNKYWVSAVLLTIITCLSYQNFIKNEFTTSLTQKSEKIKQLIATNQAITANNKSLKVKLGNQTKNNTEILESQARYRFEFIKKGEKYYQIENL